MIAGPWTEKEDDAIRKLYPSGGWAPVCKETGRGRAGIIMRASKLGVKVSVSARREIMIACAKNARESKSAKSVSDDFFDPTPISRFLSSRW